MTPKRAAAYSDTSKPISCSKRHSAVTFAVPNASTSLVGMSQDDLSTTGATACTKPFLRMLGRTAVRREESAYSFVFFQPTAAQIQAGARWFRCDLVLEAGKKELTLPDRLPHPLLPRRADDRTERCLTGTHRPTSCSRRHAYRPIAAARFKPSPYPSPDDVVQAGARVCPRRGDAYYTWGPASRWAAGDRVLVCYAKTRK